MVNGLRIFLNNTTFSHPMVYLKAVIVVGAVERSSQSG